MLGLKPIGVGGDGGLHILHKLMEKSKFLLLHSQTIDNDLGITERSIDLQRPLMSLQKHDRLQPTAASHDRVMILK
jgi:6-phosphofructokinase